MQKLASLAFFAEAAQPVLADEIVAEVTDGRVLIRAVGAERAMALCPCFAHRSIGVEAESVGFEEEG